MSGSVGADAGDCVGAGTTPVFATMGAAAARGGADGAMRAPPLDPAALGEGEPTLLAVSRPRA